MFDFIKKGCKDRQKFKTIFHNVNPSTSGIFINESNKIPKVETQLGPQISKWMIEKTELHLDSNFLEKKKI